MRRFHVHLGVPDLAASIRFYSDLFGMPPSVEKPDYAKWMLDDPRVNFAISHRTSRTGLNHLGLQAESAEELAAIRTQFAAADPRRCSTSPMSIAATRGATSTGRKIRRASRGKPSIRWTAFPLRRRRRAGSSQRVRESRTQCCGPAEETMQAVISQGVLHVTGPAGPTTYSSCARGTPPAASWRSRC